MGNPTISSYLLSRRNLPAYSNATRHPFLEQAGLGTLPFERLALWLAQDRMYAAHAYPRFIGGLIALIPFDATDNVSSPREKRNAEILRALVECLENIVREASFFEEVGEANGMHLDVWAQRKATRDYTAEMARVVAQCSLEEGIIFLWAMEQIYLDAWSYVRELQSTMSGSDLAGRDLALVTVVEQLANNWSSPEFVVFVNRLKSLVDILDIPVSSDIFSRAESAWNRVVELEQEFWPRENEELEVLAKKIVL